MELSLLIHLPIGLSRLAGWVYVRGGGQARDGLRVTQLSRGPEPAPWASQVSLLPSGVSCVYSPVSHSRQPRQISPSPAG